MLVQLYHEYPVVIIEINRRDSENTQSLSLK